jgi:hypothetical protein
VNDARDHPPVICAASAGLVLGKVRLHRRPLFVIKPEQSRHDRLHPLLERIGIMICATISTL